MSRKEKAVVAIILVVMIVMAIVLPDGEDNRTEEEIEFARSRYHSWTVFIKVVGCLFAAAFVGFLLHLHFDTKRLERIEKERQKKAENDEMQIL